MSIGAKIGTAFAVGLVIIAAIGISAYVSTQRLLEANRWVTHTHEVLEHLEDVLSALTDAETAQRGFVLTGEERYLEPYHAATGRIQQDVTELVALTRDNTAQQESLRQVQKLADAKLAELRETIQLRRKSGLEAALAVVRADRGKKIMDELRGVVAEMRKREQQLLDERNATADSAANRTIWTIAAWMPIALLVLTVAAVVLMRTVRFGGPAALPSTPGKKWGGIAIRYSSAVIVVAVAVVLHWRLAESFGPLPPFITFYPVVLLVASIGGGGPGIVATVLSALAADYWLLPPYGSFRVEAPNDVLALGIFTAVNLCLCILVERLRRARWAEALSVAQEQQLEELSRLNEELSQQSEELSQQSEELSQQTEELAQQYEELQAQSEAVQTLNTEFRLQAQALRESEERLRLMVEEVKDYAIFMLDAEGRVVTWNTGAQRFKGYSADEVVGDHFARFYPPEDIAAGKPQRELTTAAEQGSFAEEGWRVRKDGSRFWATVTITGLRDEAGKLRGFAKVTRDMSERRAMEEKLESLAQFPDENPYPVLRLSADGQVLYANAAAQVLLRDAGSETELPVRRILEAAARDTFAANTVAEIEVRCAEGRFFSFICTPLSTKQYVNLYGRDITERKQAEEERTHAAAEILRQKDLLAVTLASIGDGVVVTDAQGRVTFVNGEAERLTGWTSGEAEGQPLTAVFHIVNEHTRQLAEDPVEKVLRLGTVVGLANHTILVARDGRETPIDDSGAPIRQSDGTVQGVVLVFRDSTERKQTERSLARLAAIVESSDDAILSKDLGGVIQTWNAGAERLLGYRPEEAIGQPITLLLPPELVQEEEQILERVRSGQRVEHLETVRLTKDGKRIDVSVTVSPVKDQDGRIIGVSKVVHDISDRKRVEEALAQDRNLLRTLIDNLPDCVYVKDTESRFLAANLAIAHLMGAATVNDLLGKSDADFYPPEIAAEYRADEKELLRSGQPLVNKDEPHRDANGNRMDILTTKVPITDGQGKIVGLVGITHDITEIKRAEEGMQQAKAAAEAANVAKSQFLANMSHELRTPMNAILGMIDVALPKAIDATVQDCLQTAKGSADLLLTLLDDLLDSARIESGKLELESAPFSLRRMLDQITRILSVRASERGLCFSCRIADDTVDAVVGDRMRLQQVLLNLAGNAIKFTERGEIEISLLASSEGGEACLEFAVRDTGIGISPSGQEGLFQPFAQADPSMARRFGGTGLGLSICRSLVEMMGGRIWVESEVGKGSTFYFTVHLPVAKELPPEFEVPAAVPPVASAQLRILLVEDNPANQKLAAYVLQDRGHLVEIAGDGQEAIRLYEQNRYDVILMDVQMPGMDGLEATAAIRKREEGGNRIPIIAMTAHAMKGDRDRCLAAGMDGYLSKPIDAHETIALVETLAAGSLSGAADGITPASTLPQAEGPPATPVFDPELALRRRKAEQRLHAGKARPALAASETDARALVHELQVYQIERNSIASQPLLRHPR
jgi:PAS domain S-box-containing protein